MPMAVMHVRIVRVRMRQGPVAMRMSMRFAAVPDKIMVMLMMRIVAMTMVVIHAFVGVLVRMAFADVKPYTQGHQSAGDPEHGGG